MDTSKNDMFTSTNTFSKKGLTEIMHAVNQARADGKSVAVGSVQVYGAIMHKDMLYFLITSEIPSWLNEMPVMRPQQFSEIEKVVIRAWKFCEPGETIIYAPPVPSTDS